MGCSTHLCLPAHGEYHRRSGGGPLDAGQSLFEVGDDVLGRLNPNG